MPTREPITEEVYLSVKTAWDSVCADVKKFGALYVLIQLFELGIVVFLYERGVSNAQVQVDKYGVLFYNMRVLRNTITHSVYSKRCENLLLQALELNLLEDFCNQCFGNTTDVYYLKQELIQLLEEGIFGR